jgi:hypothetical protein
MRGDVSAAVEEPPTAAPELTVFIGGVRLPVTCTPMSTPDTDVYGAFDPAAGRIMIDPAFPGDRGRRALLHEMIHATEDIYRTNLSHEDVRRLAAALSAFFVDRRNIEAIAYLTGGESPCRQKTYFGA